MRLRPITVCCPEPAILSQHWLLTRRWCPKTWNNWANYWLLLATTLIYNYDLFHFVTVKVKTQRSCYHPQIIYWIKKQLASSLSLFTSITRSFHASSNRKLICKSPILLTDFFFLFCWLFAFQPSREPSNLSVESELPISSGLFPKMVRNSLMLMCLLICLGLGLLWSDLMGHLFLQ